jgi:hypothetical protein
MTILAERGLQPFHRVPWVNPRMERVEPRVLGERPALRWRVSVDEWYRLEAYARRRGSFVASVQPHLFGWPIDVDPDLPPGTRLLEDDTQPY